MSNLPTPVSSGTVLPALSKKDLEAVEKKAATTYLRLQQDTVRFCAYLRRLQEGEAHLLRGYSNFGKYAEATFEGMTAVNAGMLSRQGAVILSLQRNGRIDLEKKETLPGTTGVRALAVIMKRHGEDTMIQVYDQAMASDRKVTADTIQASTGLLLRPEPAELEAPEALESVEDEDDDDLEDEVTDSKEQELIDHIRDLSYDLPKSADEMAEALDRLKNPGKYEDDESWLSSKR